MNFSKTLILFLIGYASLATSQSQPIKITSERNDNIVKLYAENSSDEIYNIKLTVISTGFKHTNTYPLEECVKGGEKKYLTQMIAKKNEQSSYKISFEYSQAHQTKTEVTSVGEISNTDISNGLIIFSKEGCGRCKALERFVKEHNIEHTLLNITKNPSDASLMWRTLADNGYREKTVQTPVIVINGKLHYNLADYNNLVRNEMLK